MLNREKDKSISFDLFDIIFLSFIDIYLTKKNNSCFRFLNKQNKNDLFNYH
jgi:hypothetical protein